MPATAHRGIIEGSIFAEKFGATVLDGLSRFGEEHEARLRRYREGWRFYKGKHWDQGERDSGDAMVTMNYVRRFVDSHANFLMGKGFDITLPDDPATEEDESVERKFVKEKLDDVWRYNQKALVALEMAQVGGVTGDSFVRVFWRDNPPLEPPHAGIEVLPSQHCFPEYGGANGRDRSQMSRMIIAWPVLEEETRLTISGRRKRKKIVWWHEVITADTIETYREDDLVESKPNGAGMINVVHIPNYPVAGDVYGMRDIDALIMLQRELNEKLTDVSDVINYHGSPVTVLKGAKISQLERGANRVWSIPETADAFNLELSGDLSAAHKYVEMLKDDMMVLGSIPKGALGGTTSGAESGVAMALRYLPMLQLRHAKVETYSLGIRMIHRLVLRMHELQEKPFRDKLARVRKETRYWTGVTFPSPLPRDESIELEQARARLELGISTRKRELVRMGHGEADAEKIIEEADAEREKLAQLEFNVGAMLPGVAPGGGPSGNPNPRRPDTRSQGEAVSANAELSGPGLG